MFINVRKAHLNGVVDDQEWVFVELPPEFHACGRFGRIWRWLFGMRKAAISWEMNYAEKLVAVGYKGSPAAPTTFYNPATMVRLVVHGDNFTFSGTQVEFEKMRGLFKKWYDVKDRDIMESGTGRCQSGGDLEKNPQVYRGRQAQGHDPGRVGAGTGVQVVGVPSLGADNMDEAGD